MTSLKIYLKDEQYEELREKAHREKRSMSELIREYVAEGLVEQKIIAKPTIQIPEKKALGSITGLEDGELPFSKKRQVGR